MFKSNNYYDHMIKDRMMEIQIRTLEEDLQKMQNNRPVILQPEQPEQEQEKQPEQTEIDDKIKDNLIISEVLRQKNKDSEA